MRTIKYIVLLTIALLAFDQFSFGQDQPRSGYSPRRPTGHGNPIRVISSNSNSNNNNNSNNNTGQIRINNGSYTPNLDGLMEVEMVYDFPSIDFLFEAEAALVKINIREKRGGYDEIINPIGEEIYVDNGHEGRLFLNTADMTASIKKIPDGYYTIVGWFGRYKGIAEDGEYLFMNGNENVKIIRAHLDMLSNYTFENELDRYIAITLFYNPTISREMGWQLVNGIVRTGSGHEVNEPNPSNRELHNCAMRYGSYYILEDSDGNLYYDFRDYYDDHRDDGINVNGDHYNKDFSTYGPPERYISIKCFQKVAGLILNKDVVVWNSIRTDYLTENSINVPAGSIHYCKDLFLHEGHLVAVLSNEQGEFTVQINGYYNYSFDLIGYKGTATGYTKIYPKSYLELIERARHQQASDLAEERRRMEQEAARRQQERRNNLIARFGEEWGGLISEHKVAIGMTREMCKEAIGYPTNTFTKTTERGRCEIWVYSYSVVTTWFYFFDGKLYMIEHAD